MVRPALTFVPPHGIRSSISSPTCCVCDCFGSLRGSDRIWLELRTPTFSLAPDSSVLRGGIPKAELIQILTDGIWTQKIRAKFDGSGSGLCTFCGREEETPAHILWRCERWRLMRHLSPQHDEEIAHASPACQNCLLIDKGASQAFQKDWEKIQVEGSTIVRTRQDMLRPNQTPRGCRVRSRGRRK